ncbi:MAG: sulfatase-like hydrolase/transferase [Acidimicrobiia bacterium]|nr:sulfatase-like hydrolase/transferase [Acidimicrobiia bacterium]
MATNQPNIVFVLCDNIGWGDFSCYGGTTPTPRIDELASGGIRFNNYTVESQCTPTRSAILTGRQSVRSGTYKVPTPGSGGKSGLVPWEYTIAELLSDAGYATSLFGKWHCGETEGRLPNDQGFDEWWGYKNSADEAGWTSYAASNALAEKMGLDTPHIWEGVKGSKSTEVRELNLEVRPLLDELIVGKTTDYIKAKADQPFFTYVGLANMHPPEAVHPDFDQTDPSRLGLYADVIAELDHRVGQIMDCLDEAGIADNTLLVFSSDNGAGLIDTVPHGGSSGPFRGGFFTPPWEGSMRTAAMVRYPGTVPEGVVTEQMLSAHDWYQTFAAFAGASDKVPTDRPMDGVDASEFLQGTSEETGRESLLFFGPDGGLMSSKWRQVKVVLRHCEGIADPIVQPQFPMFFDLGSDPGERYNLFQFKLDMGWMFGVAFSSIAQFEKTVAQYPNIEPGEEFDGYPASASTQKG